MRSAVMRLLVMSNDLYFDSKAVMREFQPDVNRILSSGFIPVVSHERMAGTPHSGGYDSASIANRIFQVFPEGRILIVIREQKSIIFSSYKQYVRNGGVCSLQGYLHPPRSDGRIPLFNFQYFDYHRLVKFYLDLFGKTNVLVLPYEMFRNDPKKFILKINQFSRVADRKGSVDNFPFSSLENAALQGVSIALKRHLNRITGRRDSQHPGVLFPVSRQRELIIEQFLIRLGSIVPRSLQTFLAQRLKEHIFEEVGDRYQHSNHILSEITGIDLKKYGYALSKVVPTPNSSVLEESK